MIDHVAAIQALRTQALTLAVCTTGSTSLSNTTSAYVRAAGSFLTDRFRAGMEVTPTGFPSSTKQTITNVTATVMTVSGTMTAAAAASGRTLAVGLPSNRQWENTDFTPPSAPTPYVVEQYLPGPTSKVTIGPFGQVEGTPMYALAVYAANKVGIDAPYAYADALLDLFAPSTNLSLSDGNTLRVRTDTGPYRGQLIRDDAGRSVIPITIPLRIRTANLI